MEQRDCPFCHLEKPRIRMESDCAVAIPDGFPVTPGHTLVMPRRHVTSLFELADAEFVAVWMLVARVRALLAAESHPDGVNDGASAGQTVMHAHIHVIPRHQGDVVNPRGGVRWVISGRAAYWAGG
jgi:diadenosine tetraphosphate (Ap4A) HIT family hydrolase